MGSWYEAGRKVVTPEEKACPCSSVSEVYVSTSEALTSALASTELFDTSLMLTASPCATATACVVSSPVVALSSVAGDRLVRTVHANGVNVGATAERAVCFRRIRLRNNLRVHLTSCPIRSEDGKSCVMT
jgi:hypothetical protein